MNKELPIIEHDFRVKVVWWSDKELHQEIVGQWNATGRDFDEDEMNILIEELDRRSQRVDNVYMSEKRVHKSDKSIHEEKNT